MVSDGKGVAPVEEPLGKAGEDGKVRRVRPSLGAVVES